MLDGTMVTNIRSCGTIQGEVKSKERWQLLTERFGFRTADRAEYALLASCYLPFLVPEALQALGHLLEHFEVDYSLLPEEYCCGAPLFQQALRDKSAAEMDEVHGLAREFLENNLRQVREMGARKIITFCNGCNMVCHRFKEVIPFEVVWYPTLLARLWRGGRLELCADYYAGCYDFYGKVSHLAPDLESPLEVLNKIEGLQLHHLNHRLCCYRTQQKEQLVASIKSRTVITVCAGCTVRTREALGNRVECKVLMLPQVAWSALGCAQRKGTDQ